jgi:hypothetical protein
VAASDRLKRFLLLATLLPAATLSLPSSTSIAAEPSAIERDLVVRVQGEERRVTLDEALALLNFPSVSIAEN